VAERTEMRGQQRRRASAGGGNAAVSIEASDDWAEF